MGVDGTETLVREDADTVLGIDRAEFSVVLNDDETLTVDDLFGDWFVGQYTEFETFQSFLAESPLAVESVSDFEDIPRDELDGYVAETTDFEDWRAMVRAATEEYVQRSTSY